MPENTDPYDSVISETKDPEAPEDPTQEAGNSDSRETSKPKPKPKPKPKDSKKTGSTTDTSAANPTTKEAPEEEQERKRIRKFSNKKIEEFIEWIFEECDRLNRPRPRVGSKEEGRREALIEVRGKLEEFSG